MAQNYPKRLCPYCRHNYVLWTYPGGFASCANAECKVQALDESMEWANQPLTREDS